jgi:Protein of unknown function (DUF3489)
MTTFTINDQSEIVASAGAEEAAAATATPLDTFSSERELAELASTWPGKRLLEIWNGLPGVTPVQKFTDRNTAIRRIWARIQHLGESAQPNAAPSASTGARAPQGAPAAAPASRKASAAKAAPNGKRAAQAQPVTAPRAGSKSAQVITLLRRPNGATLSEIAAKMSWQRHTVRGFMAGAMKKAGYQVESFKPDSGERSYRLPK